MKMMIMMKKMIMMVLTVIMLMTMYLCTHARSYLHTTLAQKFDHTQKLCSVYRGVWSAEHETSGEQSWKGLAMTHSHRIRSVNMEKWSEDNTESLLGWSLNFYIAPSKLRNTPKTLQLNLVINHPLHSLPHFIPYRGTYRNKRENRDR